MELQSVSLKEYSSLRVGGEGLLVVVHTEDELEDAVTYAREHSKQIHILGGGTNSYFGEDLSSFLFIKPEFFGVDWKESEGVIFLTAGSSELWDNVVSQTTARGLWGIENLSLIPGTIGAAPVQNIGAYGVELMNTFVSLRAYDTLTKTYVDLDRDACQFGYRMSVFKREPQRYVVLSVTLALSSEARPVLSYKPLDVLQNKVSCSAEEVRQAVIDVRRAKLPDWKEYANAGSFFKNPVITKIEGEGLKEKYEGISLHEVDGGYKISAAWLIEHVAQMKGVKMGDIRTWEKQPLVLVNDGEATADDIDSFASRLKNAIFEKTGIRLEQEVERVG